jgi:hypothetical protein
VIGDFDGDGSSDLIADGYSSSKYYRICVWDTQTSPRVQILNEYPRERPTIENTRGNPDVLMYTSPGMQYTNFDDDSLFVFNDGFMRYIWEKAGSTFYWDGAKFAEFYSSD